MWRLSHGWGVDTVVIFGRREDPGAPLQDCFTTALRTNLQPKGEARRCDRRNRVDGTFTPRVSWRRSRTTYRIGVQPIGIRMASIGLGPSLDQRKEAAQSRQPRPTLSHVMGHDKLRIDLNCGDGVGMFTSMTRNP